MSWSLGTFGDLLWLNVDESRQFVAKLVSREIEEAVEYGRELSLISHDGLLRDAFWFPLLKPALDLASSDAERLEGLLDFVVFAYTEGVRGDSYAREVLQEEILDRIAETSYITTVKRVSPELFQIIEVSSGSRYRSLWAQYGISE
ncbi:hypothetical protein F0L68_39270 [Solihabitans fulvus]|uniref:Uncharacterized protein n=1 Tax=Solihabitans fulvus TaxID=1892852 RepID=A0A5B2WE19_9PSEU|nr:hypothetical protein [Solihabitans fulvus]KAA2249535.1 hypothetical protein F0L68_39270 [Solihabitans fulvus]